MRTPAVLLLLAATTFAQHAVKQLRCPATVQYRIARDLNGDGITDLGIVTGKEVWVWDGRRGNPRTDPDRKLTMPDGAALFHVGPLNTKDGNKGESIVVRTPRGYYELQPEGEPKFIAPSGEGIPAHSAL